MALALPQTVSGRITLRNSLGLKNSQLFFYNRFILRDVYELHQPILRAWGFRLPSTNFRYNLQII
jgi:hypothetical protein